MSKSRVSQLPMRARTAPMAGNQDSFHFSQTALAPSDPIIALPKVAADLSAPRPGGLLFRTASALFPHAGRLADADAAANSNAAAPRQARGVSSDDIAWMTVAAAVGLSAQARAEAIGQDTHKDLTAPVDNSDDAAKLAAADRTTAHSVTAPVDAPNSKADQSRDGGSDQNNALLVMAGGDDLLGSDGADSLGAQSPDGSAESPHPVGGSHVVIGSADGADQSTADIAITATDAMLAKVGGVDYQVITGTNGDDAFQIGSGNQIIFGGDGVDTATFAGSIEDLTLSLVTAPHHHSGGAAAVSVSAGSASNTILVDFERLKADEGAFMIVTAADGSHTVQGSAAADVVIGSGHGDVLSGGRGDDVVVAGSAADTAAYAGGVDDYYLSLSAHNNVVVADQHADRDGKDIVIGAKSASFDGETFALMAGTSGDDILVAGDGPQLMIGGAGHDIFVFNTTIMTVHRANALDMVADFSQGMDRIDLHWISFDPFLSSGESFVWDGSDSDSSGHHGKGHVGFHIEQTDSDWRTIIDGQSNGDGGSDFHIALRGHIDLKQADFIL